MPNSHNLPPVANTFEDTTSQFVTRDEDSGQNDQVNALDANALAMFVALTMVITVTILVV